MDYGLVDKVIYQEVRSWQKEQAKSLRCSFCGKPEGQVHRMIQGPGGVRICDECVQLCMSILDDGYDPRHGGGRADDGSAAHPP